MIKRRGGGVSDASGPVNVPEVTARSTTRPANDARSPGPFSLGAVGDLALVPLEVKVFPTLPRQQQILAYHLIQACEAGSRILYAQLHRHNLEIKDLLETLLLAKSDLGPELRREMERYLKRFWINSGHHDLRTGHKFVAPFSLDQLRAAARAALERRIDLGVGTPGELERLLVRLRPLLFDAAVQPALTIDAPDRILNSVLDFYRGVTEARARAFKHRYPRNSRLVREGAALIEHVWRAGGDGVPEGVYVNELHHVIKHLHRALPLAPATQREALQQLIRYLATGEQTDFEQYAALSDRSEPPLELVLGFIQTHRDPLGLKGTFQGLVAACPEPAGRPPQRGKGARVRQCELLFAAGDPGPGGRWEVRRPGSKRLVWINLPGARDSVPVSPVFVAARNKREEINGVTVRYPTDWTRYNLARARAWRIQNARPLIRPQSRLPLRAPMDRLRFRPPSR